MIEWFVYFRGEITYIFSLFFSLKVALPLGFDDWVDVWMGEK